MSNLGILAETIKKDIIERLPNRNPNDFSIQNIFNVAYGLAAVVAIGIIIYAGVTYTTSQGDPAKTKKALHTIIYAAIGLVIVILAAVITNFVIITTSQAKGQ